MLKDMPQTLHLSNKLISFGFFGVKTLEEFLKGVYN
jgi:hypothetical protein